MSSLEDKYGGIIHEMREDMTNYHKGAYNSEYQEAWDYLDKLVKAFKEKDYRTIDKLAPRIDEMRQKLGLFQNKPYLTNEEKSIIERAYKLPQNPKLNGSGSLNEKVAENTRFRAEASRRNGNKVGDELDEIIDNMNDNEVLDIMKSGDSYGQDYAQYIEENPKIRKQMIQNVKRAWKKVAFVAGATFGLENVLIQGKNNN